MVVLVADRDIPEEMVEKAADGIEDLLQMLGVLPGEAPQDGYRDEPYARTIARAALSAALAGRQVVPEPELIELPKFQGCNNSNPDLCACNDAPLLCTVCDYEIEDGMQAFALTRPMRPWIPDDGPEQEWETVWWHYTCDLRPASGVHAAGSGSGED